MGGGGGGAPQRSPNAEWGTIKNLYGGQTNQLQAFLANPNSQTGGLLSRAGSLAGFFNQGPQLGALTSPVSAWGSAFNPTSEAALTNPIASWSGSNTPSSIKSLTDKLAPLSSLFSLPAISGVTGPLSAWGSSFTPTATKTLTQPISDALGSTIDPILKSGGALTPDQTRQVSEDTRSIFASQGNLHGNQALGKELLNRQNARDTRFAAALQEGEGATGAIEGLQAGAAGEQGALQSLIQGLRGAGATSELGLTSGIEGLVTQGQQNTEQSSSIINALRSSGLSSTLGVSSGVQGLETGGLNQLTGTAQAQAGTFSTLTNPILGYLSNLFGGNLQAASAAQTASSNKSGGVAGGAISGAGKIIATALPIIISAFSDERLKQNIRDTGMRTKDDIPIKTFSYRGEPKKKYIGVIAQDVEKKVPSAVTTLPITRHKLVNLSALEAPFGELASV